MKPTTRDRFNALIDAAQFAAPDPEVWAREVLSKAAFLLELGCGYGINVVRRTSNGAHVVDVFHGCGVLRDETVTQLYRHFVSEQQGNALFESVWETRRPVLKLSSVMPKPSPAVRRLYESVGGVDSIGVLASAGVGRYFSLFGYLPKGQDLNPQARAMLARVRPHIETGLRLRTDPSLAAIAVLTDSGKILHLTAGSGLRAFMPDLKSHIARLESQRVGRADIDLPPDAWDSLCDGRWLLMQCEESDGRKHYVVFEGQPQPIDWHQITADDRKIVEYFLAGLSGRQVAARMQVSEAQVSTRFDRTARSLGLRSRTELLRLVAMLRPSAKGRAQYCKLTLAEQEVLAQLELGMRNHEIAARRGRSVKTVANQVASILRKTTSTNRRGAIGATR